jgi:hypothetical protein
MLSTVSQATHPGSNPGIRIDLRLFFILKIIAIIKTLFLGLKIIIATMIEYVCDIP